MTDDLISRSDIKTHISELMLVYSGTELDNAILNAIDNAPTVEPCSNCEDRRQAEYIRQSSSWHELQALRKFKAENERPQGEWIPISERLPDAYGEYLITEVDGNVRKDTYNDYFKKFNAEERVIAWQPLPEPYKKGGAE